MRVGVPYIYWGLGKVTLGGGFYLAVLLTGQYLEKPSDLNNHDFKIVCYTGKRGDSKKNLKFEEQLTLDPKPIFRGYKWGYKLHLLELLQ